MLRQMHFITHSFVTLFTIGTHFHKILLTPNGWSLKKFRTRFWNLGILLKISGFPNFRKDFKISGKISRFHRDFKISLKISRFHLRFQDFQKDYARFPDFNEDFCKISMKISARFPDSSADFDILILNFRMMWLFTAEMQTDTVPGRNLHSSTHYILCICDTDTMYKHVM